MVVVARFTVVGIEDRRRPTNQDRTGHQPLKVRSRLKQGYELRISLTKLH